MTAAHCDTDAPYGGFDVTLDLTFQNKDGKTENLHFKNTNPDHFWFAPTAYSGFDDRDNVPDGQNDFGLIFIPTNVVLPAEVQPLVYSPHENNTYIEQYGHSLWIPHASVDSPHMQIDRDAYVVNNHGVGHKVYINAHTSVSASGSPFIPHEHGEPIRDEQGRILTLGPLSALIDATGIVVMPNTDPAIFDRAPFLVREKSLHASSDLSSDNSTYDIYKTSEDRSIASPEESYQTPTLFTPKR